VSLVKDDLIEIKVEAKVAAGGPIEYAVLDKVIKVDRALLPKSGSFFAVEVQGDSMLEAGILNGDTLILSKINSIYPGVTAVVSIEDEGATVKKIYPHVSQRLFELRPANPKYQSRMVSENEVRFEGQLVALIRKYE
jgi:repressor LexA